MSDLTRDAVVESLKSGVISVSALGSLNNAAAAPAPSAPRVRKRPKPAETRVARLTSKRRRRPRRRTAPADSQLDTLLHSLRWPDLFAVADAVPEAKPGRPAEHPPWMHTVFGIMVTACRSKRAAEAFFSNQSVWDLTRKTLEEAWPDHPDRRVGNIPIRRDHYRRYVDSRLTPSGQEPVGDAFIRTSAEAALNFGLLDPKGPGTAANPNPDRVLIGDGTILPALYRGTLGDCQVDRETGEKAQVRYDPDAMYYESGDGRSAIGTLWTEVHVRSDHEDERVALSFAHVASGGDAQSFTNLVKKIRPLVPGAQAYAYDMAVRGKHINALYNLGLVPLVKVPLASRKKGGVAPTARIGTVDAKTVSGKTAPVQVYAVNGAAGTEFTIAGKKEFVRFDIDKVLFRGKDGDSGRVYGDYTMPDKAPVPNPLRGAKIRLRLNVTEEDLARRTSRGVPFNRTEYLRPILEGSDTWKTAYGRRNDSESSNNNLKRSLFNGRARSVGADRQWADMLGFYLHSNLRAAVAHRKRTGDPTGFAPNGPPDPVGSPAAEPQAA